MYAVASMREVTVLQLTRPQSPLNVALSINEGRAEWAWERGGIMVCRFSLSICLRFITFPQSSPVLVGDSEMAGDESGTSHIKVLK